MEHYLSLFVRAVFIENMALAYFLDPVADRLERIGLSRLMATVVILVSFVVVFVLSLMIIIPVLASQLNEFIQRVPGYITQLQTFISTSNASWLPDWVDGQMGTIRENFSRYQALNLVHRVCADAASGCDVRMSWDGDEPWMDTQDLQFFWPGDRVSVRPIRSGRYISSTEAAGWWKLPGDTARTT